MSTKSKIFSIRTLVCWGVLLLFFATCKKDESSPDIFEPITFFEPEIEEVRPPCSSTNLTVHGTSALPGESIPLEMQLTIDEVIDSLRGTYHIDSMETGFDPDVDPTNHFLSVVYLPDSNNVQTYQGAFVIPSLNVNSCDVVRLHFKMYSTLETGGLLTFEKTLRIDIK